MGMDVYGISPKCEQGVYFRRSYWGWRPLWQYCEDQHSDIAGKVQYAYSNDGDGLQDEDAVALGHLLIADIESGAAEEYCMARDAIISALPNQKCEYCNGTGIRCDQVGTDMLMHERELPEDVAQKVGRTRGWCNGCGGEGETASIHAAYYLSTDDIRDFAVFCARSGGFQIY